MTDHKRALKGAAMEMERTPDDDRIVFRDSDRYRVIAERYLTDLEVKVSGVMGYGFVPIGGPSQVVAVDSGDDVLVFIQAVYRPVVEDSMKKEHDPTENWGEKLGTNAHQTIIDALNKMPPGHWERVGYGMGVGPGFDSMGKKTEGVCAMYLNRSDKP